MRPSAGAAAASGQVFGRAGSSSTGASAAMAITSAAPSCPRTRRARTQGGGERQPAQRGSRRTAAAAIRPAAAAGTGEGASSRAAVQEAKAAAAAAARPRSTQTLRGASSSLVPAAVAFLAGSRAANGSGSSTSGSSSRRPRVGDDPRLVADHRACRPEGGAQVGHGPPLARAGAQRPVDRPRQVARQVAALAAQRGQVGAELARPLKGGAGPHRVDAGERLVDDDRQRVEVGGGARFQARRLLGGHIGQRAEHVAGVRQALGVDHPGDPEVSQLGELGRTRRAHRARARWMA